MQINLHSLISDGFPIKFSIPPISADDNGEQLQLYQKILSCKIVFPKYFCKNAKVLVKKLLTADLQRRWGGEGPYGVDHIKSCEWWAEYTDNDIILMININISAILWITGYYHEWRSIL